MILEEQNIVKLANFANAIEWQDSKSICEVSKALRIDYENILHERFLEFFDAISSRPQEDNTYSIIKFAYEALNRDQLMYAIKTPRLSGALRKNFDQLNEYDEYVISDSFISTCIECGVSHPKCIEQSVWGARSNAILRLDEDGHSYEAQFKHNAAGIAVDLFHDQSIPPIPDFDITDTYNTTNGLTALNKFTKSLRLLTRVAPDIQKYCRETIDVAILRHAISGDEFSSGSCDGWLGAIVLTNIHAPDVNEFSIIEGVVHEAVHTSLSHWEVSNGFFVPDTNDQRIESPWTSQNIILENYIHACFVWFALLSLWVKLTEEDSSSDHTGHLYLERAACGFLESPTERLASIKDLSIDAKLFDILVFMESRAKTLIRSQVI